MRILILCTGNSARSQMAEAFLRKLHPRLEVYSAGTHPAREVHPMAVRVMKEVRIDLAGHHPKSVQKFLGSSFDYVITVCSNAAATCPAFTGKVGTRLHLGFDDPTSTIGSDEEVAGEFRRVRDEIRRCFSEFLASAQPAGGRSS